LNQAIAWAGCECNADIISMSFGFPMDHQDIKDAITKVQVERDGSVVFLASAGNSPLEDESFPARHPSVISIYATNCYGTFSESNARNDSDGPVILGTFGDNIPVEICKDISAVYPKVCEPGSSVATAVAAGISATLLAYASVLTSLDLAAGGATNSTKRVFQRLRQSQGMEAVFKGMALDMQGRKLFVNPIWFWMNKPDDFSRQCAIHHWLQEVDKKHQRIQVSKSL
jgi:Subtilase family